MSEKNINPEKKEQLDNQQESETLNNNTEEETSHDENQKIATVADEADDIEKLRTELDKEKKEYLFLMAEFDNFRKRTLKEKAEIIKNASGQAMQGLLPIVDDFERGLDATKDTDDANAIREGMELIYNKLLKYLEANGVKPMDTDGKPFDADSHEAIAQVPAQNDSQKGKIIDTVSKGYTINGKVLRHAKVVVAQ